MVNLAENPTGMYHYITVKRLCQINRESTAPLTHTTSNPHLNYPLPPHDIIPPSSKPRRLPSALQLEERPLAKRVSLLFASLLSIALFLSACGASHTSVRRVGALNVGTAYRVFVQGDFAYVATNDGVAVVDVHQPDHPRQVALIELSQAAFGVYAQDDLVFIAGPADGLVIADVQDPTAPQVIGTYATGGINEVCVHDQMAYAGTQAGDLLVIDIHDPTQPSLLATYSPQGGMGLMVACLPDVVYFSSSNRGLDVLDVSEPSAPARVTTVSRTQGAKDAHVVGDLLYLSCVGNGVRVLDITDPRQPSTIASFNNGGESWGAGGNSDYLWIGDLHEGIEIYAMSVPSSPVLLTSDPGYAPHDIFFVSDYAFLADQDRGLVILEYIGQSQD